MQDLEESWIQNTDEVVSFGQKKKIGKHVGQFMKKESEGSEVWGDNWEMKSFAKNE